MPLLARATSALERRYYCRDDFGDRYNCSSAWSNYGRWIVLACFIVGAFILFLVFSCITARRRRRQGMQPFLGTGWAGGHGQPQYTNQQYQPPAGGYGNHASTPSPYGAGATQYQQPQNDGTYYGGLPPKPAYDGQQAGVELQSPGQTYQPQRGGEQVYDAPVGPPPGHKSDSVVH